jgi:hypothetical protein
MMLKLRVFFSAAAVCALIFANSSSLHATTIIKLNLGNSGPDLSMSGVGVLGTANDGNATTFGDQNTAIEYTAFLDPISDVPTPVASLTLSNLLASGPAILSGPLVIQNYAGGTLSLFDSSNSLLLSGLLTSSSLQGTIGPPGTGAVFTTNLATVTGGSLLPFIVPNTLGLSMTLTNVNGGAGFAVTNGLLNPFVADSSVSISGDPTDLGGHIPEPATLLLVTTALFAGSAVRRRAEAR